MTMLDYGPDAVIMKGLDGANWRLKDYEARGGYQAMRKIAEQKMTPDAIVAEVKKSALARPRRRGFPTGLKWSFMPRLHRPEVHRLQFGRGRAGHVQGPRHPPLQPALLIEGMIIAGYACGATVGYNYIHGEIWNEYVRFEEALEEARAAGYLGDNILGGGINFQLTRTTATAPTSAARRRRSWSRSRARRASRATSRRSRPPTASTASPPRSTTPRPSPPCRRSS
jgi:NADH-quinone oxidoreductase subunit F